MTADEDLLARARAVLREQVAPAAAVIDRDPGALGRAFDALAEAGLLALRCPAALGGAGLGPAAFFAFQEEVARASGALAFLQTQHQSAAGLLAAQPGPLRELVPQLAHGRRRLGIGFSHLRRPGPPLLRAAPHPDGGWTLEGRVAWVTGEGLLEAFLLAGVEEGGAAVFGLAPLRSAPGLIIGPPLDMAAMGSTRTVSVECRAWRLPPEAVAFRVPPGWIDGRDEETASARAAFPLGCARAALDALQACPGATAARAAAPLEEERARCRDAALAAGPATPPAERVRLRAWAHELSVRCAQAAVVGASGAAVLLEHAAQRVYREALAFLVLGQTRPVQEAGLELLVRRGQPSSSSSS